MSKLIHSFQHVLNELGKFQRDEDVLVAVSGGLDSVVLCHLLHQAQQHFAIAHVHYGLRGEESEGDALFVRELASKLNCRFFLYLAKDDISSSDNSIQERARVIRYRWFEELIQNEGFKFVLTAHQSNDQAETVLFQYFRGGMLPSLRGMLPVNGHVVRPMLGFSRDEILAFAQENGIEWREDSSNVKDDYQRNYLRHQIMPLLHRIHPNAVHSIAERAQIFREVELLVERTIAQELQSCFEKSGSDLAVMKEDLKNSSWPHLLLYSWLNPLGFSSSQIDEALALVDAQKGKMISNSKFVLWSNADHLSIQSSEQTSERSFEIQQLPMSFHQDFDLELEECSTSAVNFELSPAILYADLDKVQFPLTLRNWKAGDFFHPFGMAGSKKISDFLMQEKVLAEEKKHVFVLISSGEIMAIPGMRLSQSFSLHEDTKRVLKISMRRKA
ncbi:MAG: tRNA lysidine(34) synthetase TilS [Flavobacteriales bacterium]|nr:tRNA lysidine(34) synthetase TilS [Flavobacteriales bacterium]